MNRNESYAAFALLGLVILAWIATPLLGSRHAGGQPLSQTALGFDPSRALACTSEFVTSNPKRVAGSLEARQSSGYIQKQLRALGYSITYSHFDAVVGGRKEVGRNVMASKPGLDPRIVVVLAHYDTAPTAVQGAMDNGSGVGVMLELARVFAASPANHTLLFVGSDGEEYGMLGAEDLAQNYAGRERIAAVLSLDYVAVGELAGLELCTSGHYGGYTPPWLRDISRRAIRAEGMPVIEPYGFREHLERALLLASTEQGPFLDAGIAAIDLGSRSVDPAREWAVYHSEADVAANLKLESVGRYGRVAERILRTVDETSPIPSETMGSFRVRDSVYLTEGTMTFLQLFTFAPLALVLGFYAQNRGRHVNRGTVRRQFSALLGTLLPFAAVYYAIVLCRGLRLLPRHGWYPAKDPILENPHSGVLLVLALVGVGIAVAAYFGVRYANRTLPAPEFHVSKLLLLGFLFAVCLLAFAYNPYWAVTFLAIPATLWALTGPGDGPGARAANRIWIIAAGVVYYAVGLHYAGRLGTGWKLVWYEVLALSTGVFSVPAILLGAAVCAIGIRFLAIQSYPRSD